MRTLGGIRVATATVTFWDGHMRTWEAVEWLRTQDGVTLRTDAQTFAYIPFRATRMVEWVVETGIENAGRGGGAV